MKNMAEVFKSHPRCHQLERTTVSTGRCIFFLPQSEIGRELQVNCILLRGEGSQVFSVLFVCFVLF